MKMKMYFYGLMFGRLLTAGRRLPFSSTPVIAGDKSCI